MGSISTRLQLACDPVVGLLTRHPLGEERLDDPEGALRLTADDLLLHELAGRALNVAR
jgi:hypothetical protein